VRYGIRRADDPLMVDSLKVVDAVLKRDLPQGPGWLRYNWDGYGQGFDGGPFHTYGQGRVWPLLTGERAHYELAAGHDVSDLIKTYEGYATAGNMLPEQVWDTADRPEQHLKLRRPGGLGLPAGLGARRVPQAAAFRARRQGFRPHRAGLPPLRPLPVRTQPRPLGASRPGSCQKCIEMFSMRRPIQRITPCATLRVLDDKRFVLVWSDDNWQTTNPPKAAVWAAPDSPRTYCRGPPGRPLLYH
jgi:glucoamylase